jgi:hypothetical protein
LEVSGSEGEGAAPSPGLRAGGAAGAPAWGAAEAALVSGLAASATFFSPEPVAAAWAATAGAAPVLAAAVAPAATAVLLA